MQREYEEQQRRILQLEEQRAQLDFLQQQLDLIRLVTESGLDASILAGMQFGLFADAGQLMDTMTRVMQELIRTAQDELQIHSPSRPFREFGQNVMESMALGVSERAGQAWRTLRDELDGVTELNELPINGRQRDTGARGRTIINGGYHVNVYGYDESALEQLQKQASDGRSSGRRLQVPV